MARGDVVGYVTQYCRNERKTTTFRVIDAGRGWLSGQWFAKYCEDCDVMHGTMGTKEAKQKGFWPR